MINFIVSNLWLSALATKINPTQINDQIAINVEKTIDDLIRDTQTYLALPLAQVWDVRPSACKGSVVFAKEDISAPQLKLDRKPILFLPSIINVEARVLSLDAVLGSMSQVVKAQILSLHPR